MLIKLVRDLIGTEYGGRQRREAPFAASSESEHRRGT
jgi:hypothetical protein